MEDGAQSNLNPIYGKTPTVKFNGVVLGEGGQRWGDGTASLYIG